LTDVSFRPLHRDDLPRVAAWQSAPRVARWWCEPSDLASVEARYRPSIEGRDPTEVLVVEVDGRPAGLFQRYLHADHPDWDRAIGIPAAAGIDYYLGEDDLVGRGIGSRAVASFARAALVRYPEAEVVVAAPQQANVASWRALEKAGFTRVRAGRLDSDDPADAGPAYVYVLRRADAGPAPASGAC